jgi:hypothetical protein
MDRGARTVAVCAVILLLGFALAQRLLPIILVMPSGEFLEYALDSRASDATLVRTACYAGSGGDCRMGFFTLDIDGTATDMPFELIARADLVAPGTQTVWRFTLKDGRVFDGVVGDVDARFYLNGLSDCCQNLILQSYPARADRQAFVSVVFDPSEVAPELPAAP